MKEQILKKGVLTFMLTLGLSVFVYGQENIKQPSPINIKKGYKQNFDDMSKELPEGWAAWLVVTAEQAGNGANPRTQEATKDAPAMMKGSAASKMNFIFNYGGKLGFKNGKYTDLAIVTALNTKSIKGPKKIKVKFDAMVIRNLYDGVENTLVNALCLQYRIGEKGDFINLGETVRNGVTRQEKGNEPVDLQNFTFELPQECNNQPVVQLRWIAKYISGKRGESDVRPSFAIDNFVVEVVPK